MQSYNLENVRIYEREHKQYRKDITKEDLEQLISLMDTYDTATVCRLLVAFGYSRDVREKQEPTPNLDRSDNLEDFSEVEQ